jgi:hypothetical protein
MRLPLAVLVALTACTQLSGMRLTAADVKNAYTCISQLRTLSASAQEQVPACLLLANVVKSAGPASE